MNFETKIKPIVGCVNHKHEWIWTSLIISSLLTFHIWFCKCATQRFKLTCSAKHRSYIGNGLNTERKNRWYLALSLGQVAISNILFGILMMQSHADIKRKLLPNLHRVYWKAFHFILSFQNPIVEGSQLTNKNLMKCFTIHTAIWVWLDINVLDGYNSAIMRILHCKKLHTLKFRVVDKI